MSSQAPAAKKELPEFDRRLTEKISAKFGERAPVSAPRSGRIAVSAKRKDVLDVARFVRDDLGFDHAESVTGTDYPQDSEIEITYHLGSYSDIALAGHILELSTRVPREENPKPGRDSSRMPSLRDIFYSVEFHERECFEMLGVYFEGHPDNRRLLLPEDWADLPPLRKDFKIKGR